MLKIYPNSLGHDKINIDQRCGKLMENLSAVMATSTFALGLISSPFPSSDLIKGEVLLVNP